MGYIPQVADILCWNGRAGKIYLMVMEVDEKDMTFTAFNFTTQRINNNAWTYDYDEYSRYGHYTLLG